MGKFIDLYLREQTKNTFTESAQLNENIASHVAVHKAYSGKVDAIKSDLEKSHSVNGEKLHTSEHGDYVHIHLPKKDHNKVGDVKRTLQKHEGHPAYEPSNVQAHTD